MDDVKVILPQLLAEAVNPAALALLFIVVMKRGWDWKHKLNFLTRSLAAILISGVLAHINRYIAHGVHFTYWPSGHMTFYSAVATSFLLMAPRSLLYTIPAGIIYGYIMIYLKYHDWADLFIGLLLGSSVRLFVFYITREKNSPTRSS